MENEFFTGDAANYIVDADKILYMPNTDLGAPMRALMVRKKVKRFLESGEMSQNELAWRSGLAPSTISEFMKERNEPTKEE